MSYRKITQVEARAMRREIVCLRAQLQDRDSIVERRPLSRWQGIGSRIIDELSAASKMGFRVEVTADGDVLCTSAVRRKSGV